MVREVKAWRAIGDVVVVPVEALKHAPQQRGAPVPCGEVPVPLRQSALLRVGEKHIADVEVVREFLNGAPAGIAGGRRVVPENSGKPEESAKSGGSRA